MRGILGSLFLILFSFSVAFAGTQVTVDLTKLPSNVQSQVLDQLKQDEAKNLDVSQEQVEKWANIGKMLAVAMNEFCTTIGVQVNEFIKTPAGMLVSGVLIWKYIGSDILRIILGSVMWFMIMSIICVVGKSLLFRKKVVTKIEKDGKTTPKVEYLDPLMREESWVGTAVLLTILGTIITIVWFVVVLP